jgi:hypothetical protein
LRAIEAKWPGLSAKGDKIVRRKQDSTQFNCAIKNVAYAADSQFTGENPNR